MMLVTSTELYKLDKYPTYLGQTPPNDEGDYLTHWSIKEKKYSVKSNLFIGW